MAAYQIKDVPGFEDQFAVVRTDTEPHSDGDEFCNTVDLVMRDYTRAVRNSGDALDRLRIAARNNSLKELRVVAEDVVTGTLTASLGILSCYVVQGRWEHALEIVNNTPFTVEEVDVNGVAVKKNSDAFAYDLSIVVADSPVPPEKLNFKVDLDRTI